MGRKRIEPTREASGYHKRQAAQLGLYQKAGRGAWYVPIWIDGKRHVRSTGTADLAEALAKVPSLRAEVEAQAAELSRRSNSWDLQTATDKYYEAKKKAGRVENTLKGYRSIARKMIGFFGATLLLEELTRESVQEYIVEARKKRKPYTVEVEVSYLGAVVAFAHKLGKCSKPASEVMPEAYWGNYEPRKRFLSPEELGALLSVSPPDWQACIMGWTYLAANLMELFTIKVADVDFRNGLVTIHGTKTRSRKRTIPIPDPIMPLLRKLTKGKALTDIVFPIPKGERGGCSKAHIHNRFPKLVEAANIPHCTIHDLRRTYGSQLASAGVSLHVIAKLLGHSSVTVTEKTYAHLANETLVKAVALLPSPALTPVPRAASDNAAE